MRDEYMSVSEVAEMLGVSGQTIRNWIYDGIFREYALNPGGGKYLIKRSDVTKAIQTGRIISRR